MPLTNARVLNARAADRNYKLADSRGLHLLVSTAGGKSWRLKYRYGGKERLLTLGRYPSVTLASARQRAEDARKLLEKGMDPAVAARQEKQARIEASLATFRRIADGWLADQSSLWSRSNASRVRHRIEGDLYPAFGNIPIASIDSAMILRVLRSIEDRGSIETAKRVCGYVRRIFRKARAERLVPWPIVMELHELKDALKPSPPGARLPALTTLPELLSLQEAVDRSTANLTTKLASRLLALTLVRVGVLRTAPWAEFEGIDWSNPDSPCERPIWRIPASRMKLEVADKLDPRFAHDVPLSSQAVEVVRALRLLTSTSSYLFPSSTGWHDPMSDGALSTLYKSMDGARFKRRMVPHGWRSSFATIMNERAADLERDGDRMLIDMVLAHVPKGMSSSEWAYNRARYRRPRGLLLQAWADLVTADFAAPSSLLPGYA
jgi:integrase